MTDIRFIRWANIAQLAGSYPTLAEFARKSGVGSTQLTQIIKNKGDGSPIRMMGEKLARRIEANLALEPRWLDTPHDESEITKIAVPGPGSGKAPEAVPQGLAPTAGRTSSTPESADSLNVAGLTLLQKAAVETLIKLAREGGLSNRDCVQLLDTWTSQLEQCGENQFSTEST